MMIKYGLFVRLEAKPGKEQVVANFLVAGLEMANQEATAPIGSPSSFRRRRSEFSMPLRAKRLARRILQATLPRP
jgi:hypothetical protein